MDMVEDFVALSRILTGVEDLDRLQAQTYLDRLNSIPDGLQVKAAIARYRTLADTGAAPLDIGRTILADISLRAAVTQIVLVWFTSATMDTPPTATSGPVLRYTTDAAYFSGLVWRAIGAHVPGLSGGYSGHWRYRPENEPEGAA
jgi:hypothetical protein